MSRDSFRGEIQIPFRVRCRVARCKAYMVSWTASAARAENQLGLSGWGKKRGYWCCPEHVRAEVPMTQLRVVDAVEDETPLDV